LSSPHYFWSNRVDRPVTDIRIRLFVDKILDVLSLIACCVHFHNCARREETQMVDPDRYPGAPRWVKVFGIAIGAAALLVVIVIHAGGGPRHNVPSAGGIGDHTAPEGSR
jgi:hypothetical protein